MVVGDDAQMRTHLAKPPRWVLAVITGFPFGITMGIFTKIDGPTSWTESVVGGLVIGVVFGVAMAFSLDKRLCTMDAAVGDLPTGKRKAAHRAADRGPLPADPEIRAAALRIAMNKLDLLRPKKLFIVAAMVLLLTSTVGLVVTES